MEPQSAAAIGRLARGDVVGLSDQKHAAGYADIEDRAVRRLTRHGLSQPAVADLHYGMIIKLLQDARLTISLRAFNWFYYENKSTNYTTLFERGKSGASDDIERRDGVENSMFGYAADVMTNDPNVKAAQTRLLKVGVRLSPHFQPAMRPRYAAVDFAHCVNGGLSKYGRSFLVLKEYLKHNATYCHRDSFEVANDLQGRRAEYVAEGDTDLSLSKVSATYFQLGKIVLYCDPDMLRTLHRYATGQSAKGSEANVLGGFTYIEAQVHADVVFNRDVSKLCVSRGECSRGPDPAPHPAAFNRFRRKTRWDQSDSARTLENARKFAAVNRLQCEEVP